MPQQQTTTESPNTTALECIECGAALGAQITMAGEILDCPDCGVELEVRSINPIVLSVAPQVEEDWGE